MIRIKKIEDIKGVIRNRKSKDPFNILLSSRNRRRQYNWKRVTLMGFNDTFNSILVISCMMVIFLVEETRVPGEKTRPVASH
jgi:hypothetical protein